MIKNYSVFIRPISIAAHLFILNLVFKIWWPEHDAYFTLFLNTSWILVSIFAGLYHFHRTITVTRVMRQLWVQFSIYTLVYFAYFSVTDTSVYVLKSIKILLVAYVGIMLFRAMYFYALRRYRLEGGNYKNVILIGSNAGLHPLVDFMMNRADFGFKILGFFSDKKDFELHYKITERAFIENETGMIDCLGNIDNCRQYALEHKVDEIYCSISELKEKTIQDIIAFADQHLIKVKLVPDNKNVMTKNLNLEYYGFVPVFGIRNFPLDTPIAKFLKRTFDIFFSLLIIVFLLSWLTPILYFFIKRESSGPVFFKQKREGIKGNSFTCYKYRSMGINDRAHKDQTVKDDIRITKVGKFLRKTSIDELPQFLNVLKGEMSVVGPRPHMLTQSKIFKKIVDKYMVRHFVKPGITGLAQVRGFRGEIETDQDIINRVKYDIFYVENWSFIMDLNIILKTVLNVFKGEKKAY